MLYFPLLLYSLHACLICIVNVEIVPKLHLNSKNLKNCNFATKCLITPPLDTSSQGPTVGNQAVDAVGATKERREELIRARNERRRIAAQLATSRAALARPGSLHQNMTRHQESALIGLGADILVLLKLLLGSVMLLCALCVLLLMKK